MTTISFRSLKQDQGRRFTINIFLCHRIAIVIFMEKEKKINLKLKHNRYKANVYAVTFSSPGGKICFYNIKRGNTKTMFSEGEGMNIWGISRMVWLAAVLLLVLT